jgi:hypothetical protein
VENKERKYTQVQRIFLVWTGEKVHRTFLKEYISPLILFMLAQYNVCLISDKHGRFSTYSSSRSLFKAYRTERVEQETRATISLELTGPSSRITLYTFLHEFGSCTSSRVVLVMEYSSRFFTFP